MRIGSVSRQTVDRVAPPLYALLCVAVLVAPATAIKLGAGRSGMHGASDNDLLIASALLGAALAVLSASRLRSEEMHAVRRPDMWIAAFDALVVLMLGATVLPLVVLWGFTDEHATMAQEGYPVVALWVGLQIVAVVLAEATGRFVFWWLEQHRTRRGSASA